MSAVKLLSSLQEKPNDGSLKEGAAQGGLEDGTKETVCGGGSGDPAVLAVGPARRPLTYTREQLMRLRDSPLVKRGIDNAFTNSDAIALVLKKRPDSPNDTDDRGARGDAPNENHKGVYGRDRDRERKSADPRERVRKESESSGGGIVLSPQRRSFTSGCGAPAGGVTAPPHLARTRPDSPLSATAPPPASAPPASNKTEQVRRIGSGRIMLRDVPAPGWEEGDNGRQDRVEPYRPPPRDRDRDRDSRTNGDSRYDRRSFGRDSYSSDMKRERDDRFNNEKTRDREDNRRSGGRYSQRRFEKEDEPEWFSGGPTSQLETIELRGFDEPIRKNGTANSKETEKSGKFEPRPGSAGSSGTWRERERARDNDNEREREGRSTPTAGSTTAADVTKTTTAQTNDKDSGVESKADESNYEQHDFNLDEFLKLDTIPDVLTNGSGETEAGSRFSRWFRRDSPTNDARHYERLISMVDDLDSCTRMEPPTGAVFAPISPAASAAPTLLDLLRRANTAECRPDLNATGGAGGGKMHSLEELEARLRPQHSAQHHSDHDISAFKRLLAQVSGGHAVPAATDTPRPPQNLTLLQMLHKSMEQQQQQQHQQQQHQQQQQQKAAAQAQPHIPQELLYKLLQVQQRQQQQASELSGGMGGVSGVGGIGPSAADRELLQRPEAQAIIHGLKAGEITVQHLMQQLNNPGLQSRHREVLLTILRLHQQQRQMGGSPLPTGVGVGVGAGSGAAHLSVPPHHQPLRLSPLPHSGVPARIPSPRELAAHTQSIMQGALIKKKLEEQRENFRRRHEMHQQPKQATPISFTPTSVLRKMTAEKESDALSPKPHQWAQLSKMPQGRPIVKGNQGGGGPPMGYAPSPADYQQHYLSQQQMPGNVRPFPHPQQRPQVPSSYSDLQLNNVTHMSRGGTTLHQLLVHSHQRSLNEMGVVAGTGGGDNQLARWFSPELLARASAGKLPSVHVPNALSLEDLERHHHSPAPPVRN